MKDEIIYTTELSGSKLQIQYPNGKIQYEIEPSGTTLNIKDSRRFIIGNCEVTPSRDTEKVIK